MKNLNLVGKSGTRMKVITIGATGFIGRYAVTKLIEAGHKRRVNASLGFRSFDGAQRTIQGYEAMHMIRKGQVRWLSKGNIAAQVRFVKLMFDLAA